MERLGALLTCTSLATTGVLFMRSPEAIGLGFVTLVLAVTLGASLLHEEWKRSVAR